MMQEPLLKRTVLFACLMSLGGVGIGSEKFDFADVQNRIQSTVAKTMPAVVSCSAKVNGKVQRGGFSAVIVSEDGYILTAAHCIMASVRDKKDKVRYVVRLSDGRTTEAKALGHNRGLDCALMKITEEGEWPVAEMGDSSQLVKNQACVGISHPAGHNGARGAVVRFGRIKEVHATLATAMGMIQTTCLIEPGDSGGPVFDLEGRIIGINSQIRSDFSRNFQVAVNTFKEYWKKMEKRGSFTPTGTPGVPNLGLNMKSTTKGIELNAVKKDSIAEKAGLKKGDKIARIEGARVMKPNQLIVQYIKLYSGGADTVTLQMRVSEGEEPREVTLELPERPERTGQPMPELVDLVQHVAELEDELDDSTVLIASRHGSRSLSVFGTFVSEDGLLVSKSSQVGDDEVFVKLRTGDRPPVEVLARDEATDLVLLRCEQLAGRKFVSLDTVEPVEDLALGRMLLSPSSRGDGCVSVIGSKVFGQGRAKLRSNTYHGISWQPSAKKIPKVRRVGSSSPAEKGKLKAGDLIISVREISTDYEKRTPIKSINDFEKFIKPLPVKARILVDYKRGGSERTSYPITLDRRPNTQVKRHAADFLVGGKSERRTGFQSVFTHDATFQQKECGSPVFDTEGNFVALNIARHSRAQCYAVPAKVVKDFVDKQLAADE